MKNLESFGVQELNIREQTEIDGGFLFELFISFTVGVLIGRWIAGKL